MQKATHYRKGAKVIKIEGNTVEFDGTPDNVKSKDKYVDQSFEYTRGKKKISGNGRFYINHGINAAKRYVRKNGLVTYNVS
jgi:hypothetical protein